MANPWSASGGRIEIIMNHKADLNLLVPAATESIQQWARDIKGMGIFIVIYKFGSVVRIMVANTAVTVCAYK
jgi:hypothetical protein